MTEITVKRLADLIANGESETLEFKESFGDEALETIGAFANAHGGILLIGIKDSGDVQGIQLGKKRWKILPIKFKKAPILDFNLLF